MIAAEKLAVYQAWKQAREQTPLAEAFAELRQILAEEGRDALPDLPVRSTRKNDFVAMLDTNVISELARREPHPGVLEWAKQPGQHMLSVISVDEILFGLSSRSSPRLLDWMNRFFELCPVLPISEEIARRAGSLRGDFQRRGIVRQQADMLIAATAQAHNLTLVTRNTRDFKGCGIGLLDPFEMPYQSRRKR